VKCYLDTSALTKLYFPEKESAALSKWILSVKEPISYSLLHELELKNAIELKRYRQEISKQEHNQIINFIEEDKRKGILCPVKPSWTDVLVQAILLSRKNTHLLGCRSLDILHVAIALKLECTHFLTFDDRQCQLAKRSSLILMGFPE
jgi:predicted nucleic acid-binding protein